MTDRNTEERRTFRDTASTTPADRAHARCIGLTRNWWALTVRGAAAEQLGRWMLVLAGVLSLLWGVMLIAAPFAGAIVLTWWMGAYALLFGATLIGLSVRLRSRRRASGGVPLVV